jgi:hypothetical protein
LSEDGREYVADQGSDPAALAAALLDRASPSLRAISGDSARHRAARAGQ